MAHCHVCEREVGVVREPVSIMVWLLIILGLIIPFWIITLPICWGAALGKYSRRTHQCGLCRTEICSEALQARLRADLEREKKKKGNSKDWE